MPYNKTKVREQLREKLNRLYNLRDSNTLPLDYFTELTQSLEDLWEKSASLYLRDGKGSYPSLNGDRYRELIEAYADANRKAEKLLTDPNDAPETEPLKHLSSDINALLLQDMNALENIVPGENITLPEVIEKGRSVTVDLGKVTLTGSGNALSNRIPVSYALPDGSLRNGFFTQKSTVPGKETMVASLQPLEEKYPQFDYVFRAIKAADEKTLLQDMTWMAPLAMPVYLNDNDSLQKVNEQYYDMFYGDLKMPPENKQRMCAEPGFWQFYSDLYDALGPIKIANMTYTETESWLGGQSGERIDNRNSALSMVAKLMGRPNLIAPAEPMTIIVDGKKLEGTFMENAYGKETYSLKPDDPIRQYGPEHYDNPAVFADIADLQVIDFISGNVDRHEGNFFMQFSGEGENAKLTKITGIDNDLSFGMTLDQEYQGNRFVTPKKMGLIEQETAAKVLGLTETSLKFALAGFGLNDRQLDCAWQRTRLLQDKISASIEHYRNVPEGTVDENFPRIVSRENMDRYTLKSLSRHGTNQFKVFLDMKDKIKSHYGGIRSREKLWDKHKERLGLRDPQPKPAAKRLIGERVMDDLFIRPEEKPAMQSRVETVDAELPNDVRQDVLKGSISARKALSYPDEKQGMKKGFFTARTELDEKKQLTTVFNDLRVKYPRYSDFLGSMEHYVKNGGSCSSISRGFPGYSRSDMDALTAEEPFRTMLKETEKAVQNQRSILSQYTGVLGLSKTATIDMRNVGMSRIAELMGSGSRIAASRPMRLKQGNQITEGVFMELAEGRDVGSIRPGDPMLSYTEEVYNYGPGLKALSDLQIIDYVCMNVDRHAQNMTYQFAEVDGKTRFVGVCGFDNDASFMETRVDAGRAFSNDSALDDIKTISREQADFLMKCDPAQIEEALDGIRFTPKEVTATVDRIERLRERIRDNRIQVLDDDAWKNKTMQELCVGGNIFARVQTQLAPKALERKAELNQAEGPAGKLTFAEGRQIRLTPEAISEAREKQLAETEALLTKRNENPENTADRIMKERTAAQADVRRESEENRLAKDPLGKEALPGLENNIRGLDSLLKKADHFFGGSDEFKKLKTGYQDFQHFMETEVRNGGKRNSAEQMQLQEDFKEHMQVLELLSDAMIQKVGITDNRNQLDRKDFADAVKRFSRQQQESFRAYNRALLENQQELAAEQNRMAAKPLQDYCAQLYGERSFNPRKDEEYPDHMIKTGLSAVAGAISADNPPERELVEKMVASMIVQEVIKDVRAADGGDGFAAYRGKLTGMVAEVREKPFVKQYAERVTEDPKAFADRVVSGQFRKVYQEFVRSIGEPVHRKQADPQEKQKVKESTAPKKQEQAQVGPMGRSS